MGGIYIPDVSLPRDGDFELWIAVKKDGSFAYNVRGAWRAGNQKAVPVPPHGRCVDADKLMQEMRLFIKENMLSRDDARELLETIEEAPTIIEAEEGKI